jgi:adenylate kinase family enzyme
MHTLYSYIRDMINLNHKRIAIIGNAGSGKSFLADELNALTGVPVFHLDQYYWKPNWVRPDLQDFKLVHDRLCDQSEWIIEGMNLQFLDYRMQRADLIIFLNIPLSLCLWRVFKRTIHYYGTEPPDSAPGCKEEFNTHYLHFLSMVWNFDQEYLPLVKELFHIYAATKKIYMLNSQQEIDAFVAQCTMQKR